MSVILTDMDMPDNCSECKLKTRCEYALANGWLNNKRDENCPLKPNEECKNTLKRVVCKRKNEILYGWIDESRQMIFTQYVTVGLLIRLGYEVTPVDEKGEDDGVASD